MDITFGLDEIDSIDSAQPSRVAPSVRPPAGGAIEFDIADIDPPSASSIEFDASEIEPSRPRGLLAPGNIDLFDRPHVANRDGSISTVRTISINDDGREVLIPTVVGDRVLSDDDAIDEYVRTNRHLGMFDSPESATSYAQQLHDEYAAGRYDRPLEPDFRTEVVGQMPREEASFGDRLRDIGISALKGAIAVPEAAVGVADIVTGGRVGRFLEDATGFRPQEAKAILDTYYSDPQRAAFENVEQANGLIATAVAALSNPSVLTHSIIESIPSMLGGAGVARGALAAAPRVGPLVAGAIGEGVVSAGTSAEQTRQQVADRLLTARQSGLSATSGALTGLLGAFGGKLSQRLGIADVDTMLAGAAADDVARKGLARQVVEGAAAEGFLEELPQSVQEQVSQNASQGRDLLEDVDDAAVLGALAGAAMGGGANLAASRRSTQAPQPQALAVPAEPIGVAETRPIEAPIEPVRSEAPVESAPAAAIEFGLDDIEATTPVGRAPLEAAAPITFTVDDIETAPSPGALEAPPVVRALDDVQTAPQRAESAAAKKSSTPFDRATDDTRSRSVDASPVVRAEAVSRDDAFLMRWLADDLEAMPFQQGGSTAAGRRAAYEQAGAEDEAGKRGMVFNPRVAGTPTQTMFKAMGVTLSRAEIAHQIDRYLTGDAKTPGKGAEAAIRLAPVMAEAWDGARFDYARVRDATLRTAGISRKQLRSPVTLPSEEQPADLVERYLPPSDARRAEELQAAQASELARRDAALNTIAEGDERAAAGTFSDADIDFSPDEIEAADTETDEQIRAKTLAEVDANPDAQVDRYLAAFGPVLNADNASELFEAYRRSPETRATRVKAVRPAASRVVERAFERMLAEPVPAGKRPVVLFTSGGNGSGKSTVLSEDNPAHIVFDTTLSQLEPSAAKIEQALAAGRRVHIRHVRRDVMEAWRSVLDRAAGEGDGRTVTLEGHLQTHLGAQQTLLALAERYRRDPRVVIEVTENAPNGLMPRSLDWLARQEYPDASALRATAREILEAAREQGAISDAIYAGASGRARRDQSSHGPDVQGTDRGPRAQAESRPAVSGRRSETPDVDRLDTGEAQPRLPADTGRVRDVENPTPTETLPDQTLTLRGEQIEPEQASLLKPTHGRGSSGGTDASVGDYANLPAKTGSVPLRPGGLFTPPPTTPTVSVTKAIEFPEMVGMARELVRTPEVVKRFRNDATRGTFREGSIRLHADLFKAGQEGQLAATLAHEIGHLVDWLPDQSLKRGNLLGRLKALHGFLKQTFTAADGTRIENAQVKKELQALSDGWRPWDRAQASPAFAAYRQSARELYADAISVLLNNPGMLEAEAPIFYRQFFEALDHKPDVRRAYFDLQELLSGTRDELIARRRAGVQGMFVEGDTKAIDLERLRQAEKAASRKNYWTRFRIQMIDKNTPFNDRVKEAEKATGAPLPEGENPRYFLEERSYMGAKLKAFTEEHFQPVYESLTDAGVSWHEFGEALFYERIAAGDRSQIANPRGITPAAAQELLDVLRKALTSEQRMVLVKATSTFRAAIKLVAEQAFDAGLYKPDMYARMKENPAYVTFRVIDHLESHVTSKVYQQVGTLKDVTNPADATILKTLVTLRAIEQQKMKVAAFGFLDKYFPEDIQQAQHAFTGRGMVPVEPPDPTKQVLVRYYEKGALRGKYVDPYIADSLNNESVGSNWAVIEGLRWVNGYLRPIYTGLNLGFQSFNSARDFFRFWKNFPQMTLARAAKRYIEAVPMARLRGFGPPQKPSARMQQAAADLREAEYAKILGITFNDVISGRQVEDTQIEDTLAKVGIGAYASADDKKGVRATLGKVLTWIKNTGDFIETLPKAAAIIEFKGRGRISDISPAQRSFIRRKVGSPDYLSGGTFKPITNEVLLFSNAITQAWRADLEVMRDPKTRGGYWWKTTAVNIAPKLALFAALYLVPDDDDPDGYWKKIRSALEGITEYDLTNYLPIPIGTDAAGNTIYVRLPQDDSGRLMGGLTWKMLQALRGNREAMKSAMQVLDYTAGQLPSISPILDVPIDVVSVASGRNVYDSFRGRFLFTEDELKAADSRTLKKFLGYEFQQLGGGIVWKFYPGEMAPREKTPGQKILEFPVLSNVVGRWVRITNYGKTERMREAQSAVQRDEARIRLDERAAVNEALREYKQLIPPQQTPAEQGRMAREIVSRLYGDADAKKRNTEYRDVLRKIRMGALRGKADPLVDAVMSSTSTAQRVAILMDERKRTPPPVFSEWMQRAQREGVISEAVVDAYRREVQQQVR